jgi:hypothetical protein
MASKLRKVPNSAADLGAYEISGSLDGEVPGRRTVKDLHVKRLDGRFSQGLTALLAFDDVRRLTLEQIRDVDLDVLNRLSLDRLRIEHAGGLDLRVLSLRDGLRFVDFIDLDDDCIVPDELALPSSLEHLGVTEGRAGRTGRQVQDLLEAIDWSRLTGLTSLYVRVGGLDAMPPIETDMSFLRFLPELKYLDLGHVYHAGAGPSPLEPPFEGLSRKLERVITEAWDPAAVREGLQRHVGVPVDPTTGPGGIHQRRPYIPPPPPWAIHEPANAGSLWSAYGSLADAAGLTRDETESRALRQARARLRDTDPALLRRLDFDPESSGTAILASSRDDLVAALRILGLGQR